MLSEEQRQLRDTARAFAARELEPHAERWDRERAFPDEAVRALGELGFFGLLVPEDEGGTGFDSVGFCLAVEEISRAVPALGLLLSIHNGPVLHLLRSAGTVAGRERWLARLATGETLGAFALSEAGAGSDVAAVATRYGARDGGFVVDGEKQWVSGVGRAGMAVVFARAASANGKGSDPGSAESRVDGRAVMSAFLVDLASDGVQPGAPEETMGLRAAPVGSLTLASVRVGAEALLGEEGMGFTLALEALALGRLGIAAQSLGIAGRAIDLAVEYARERRQFGRPIAEFQGVRLPLADLAARLAAARALVLAVAGERDAALGADSTRGGAKPAPARQGSHPGDFAQRAAMAKLVAGELAMAAALQAVQAFGGYGYVKDYPVERFFRDAKACQIYEGTSEIQRIVIAKRLFAG